MQIRIDKVICKEVIWRLKTAWIPETLEGGGVDGLRQDGHKVAGVGHG